MELTAGTRLGPYEIVSHIGAGAMGVVYKAQDTRLGRNVAIKVLPPVFARDPLFTTNTDPVDVLRNTYAPSADGQRFLVISPVVPPGASALVGMLNWTSAIRR